MGMGISIMGSDFFAQSPLGLWRFAVAQSPQGLVALLSLKPRRLFISFARTKETKQRKFAVCTFLPTPALFSAKQKELASLKQLFVFHAPKSPCASRQKSEAGPFCFFMQHRFARWGWCFLFFASFVGVGVCGVYFWKSLHDETILLFVCLFWMVIIVYLWHEKRIW